MTAPARAIAVAAAAALGGCPAPVPARLAPAAAEAPSPSPSAPAKPPPDAREASEASQDERLAAIQKAMNDLDTGAHQCWAAAAAERLDVEGELVATIEIGPGSAKVTLDRDTTRSQALQLCMSKELTAYGWAPPLQGQTIRLPFRFRAPDSQNVIDRRLVGWTPQAQVAVAVLLDQQNTGNGAASMFEVAIGAGAATGARIAERPELWYFLRPATVEVTGAASRRAVAAGDMMYVPANAARNVIAATTTEVHAVVVVTPGGREGAARAGALPTPELSAIKSGVAGPVQLPASAAHRYPRPAGAVTIFAEPSTIKDRALAATIIELPAGASIPEHVHAGETELLYVLAGAGTLTVKGTALPVIPTTVAQIPPNTPHAFTATEDVRAVQVYTPAGPEQRFKTPPGHQARP